MKQRTTPAALTAASLLARRFAAVLLSVAVAAAVASPGVAHADSTRDGQWYASDFELSKVHKLSQGKGVRIGVIDSGVDTKHPDLDGNVKKGASYDENGATKGNGHNDKDCHGTAVTSVLAGHGHGHGKSHNDGIMGIAPKATIIPVAFNWEGNDDMFSDNLADAIRWLLKQDVDIITTSMGGGSSPESDNAIQECADNGVPFVASAGNRTRPEVGGGTEESSDTEYPGTATDAIPVTGTTPEHTFWEDGATLNKAATQPQFGLSAPAKDIPVALPDNKYDTVDGTSFSAPIVAGTLALIKSAYPDLNYEKVNERLLLTTDDKGKKGYDNKYGWGIVNPYKSLTEDVDHYKGGTSTKDDITPLDEQGKQPDKPDSEHSGKPGDNSGNGDNSSALSSTSSGLPLWAIITLAAAAVLLTALITTVTLKIRHNKTHTPPPGTMAAPPGPPPPGNMALGQPPPVQSGPAGQAPPAPPGTNPPQGPPTTGPSDGQPPPH